MDILTKQKIDTHLGIYVQAFPGMGKSTYASGKKYVVDADFGLWRQGKMGGKEYWELTKEESAELHAKFADEIINPALLMGKVVLTNEPSIRKYVLAGVKIYTIVPHKDFQLRWLYGILDRAWKSNPEDFSDDKSFVSKLLVNYKRWINNWSGGTIMRFKSYDSWEIIDRIKGGNYGQ